MLIKLKVHPGSKRTALFKKTGDSYEVWVKAPAERGLANSAALHLLAKALNQVAGRIRIIKGATSPSKIVQVPD